MTWNRTVTSRTFSTSSNHLEVIHAHGHLGSNHISAKVIGQSVPVRRVGSQRGTLISEPSTRTGTLGDLGSNTVAGVRNLKQAEAAERARLLGVTAYDISLDLTDGAGYPGERVFRSVTEVRFTCREPGVGTFIEVAAESVRSATLNGEA